jgi:hypothetical protein
MKKSRLLASIAILTIIALVTGYLFAINPVKEARADTTYTLRTDTFTSAGVWTAPDGITSVVVEAWGGGGGGKAYTPGGGGGAYASSTVAVTPGNAYYIVVGQSGANADGGNSTFATTTVVAAQGLSGGHASKGGTTASSTGDTKYAGADGSGGNGGGAGGDSGAGSNYTGGARNGGNGRYGQTAIGSLFGGGAGDVGTVNTIGAAGHVRITYRIAETGGFPTVVNRNWNRQTNNSQISSTAPSGSNGDLLLFILMTSANSSPSSTAGWTKLVNIQNGISGTAFYRTANGLSADNITSLQFGVSAVSSYLFYRFQNTNGVPVAATSSGNSTNVNPPNVDCGASGKNRWLAIGGVNDTRATITGSPTSYGSTFIQPGASDGAFPSTFLAERTNEAQTEDPGTFTSQTGPWVGMTICIPGTASGGTGPTPPTTALSSPSKGWGAGVSVGGALNW